MSSNINIFFKDLFKDFLKWKNKKKIIPKEYTTTNTREHTTTKINDINTKIIDLKQKTVTSTRTTTKINTLTLKNNKEFCFYINELAEWTYML